MCHCRRKRLSHGRRQAVLQSTLERWFTPGALADPDHPGVRYARERLLADRPEDFAAGWRAMSTHDVSGQLGEIRVPVTAIAGERDVSVPVFALEAIAKGVAHGRVVVLPGPHMLQLEERRGHSDLPSRS